MRRDRGGRVNLYAAAASSAYEDARAHDLRDRYHALFGAPELPVPVESIAEDLLGLHVCELELDGLSGLLFPAQRQICVNALDVPTRRRFTLAHELGHWICQHLEGKTAPVYCRAEDVSTTANRSLEREANIFAAELLMPEPTVRDEFRWSTSVAALAARFGVSTEAMQWRLYSFDLAESPGAHGAR